VRRLERKIIMRFGLTSTAALSAALVAGSILAAAPAHAAASSAYVRGGAGTTTSSTGDGSIPSDCSLTFLNDHLSAAVNCTGRPSAQVWHISVLCHFNGMFGEVENGNKVTGDGTSTANCGFGIQAVSFLIDS
jgi:hypothetical protein